MYMSRKDGLKFIINFHRINGSTYLGWNFRKNTSTLKKVMLIAWNLLYLGLVGLQSYLGNYYLNKTIKFTKITMVTC